MRIMTLYSAIDFFKRSHPLAPLQVLRNNISGRRIKLRYAHLGGHNPPVIVIHGNQLDSLPDSYKRYLASVIVSPDPSYGNANTPITAPLSVVDLETTGETMTEARYLSNEFIKHLELVGTPLKLEFRGGINPLRE